MQPLAAQLLYDLGLKAKTDFVLLDGPLHPTLIGTILPVLVPWPPAQSEPTKSKHWLPPPASLYALIPLRMMAKPTTISAQAACTQVPCSKLSNCALMLATVTEYLIGPHNMEMIYLSPDPYGQTFNKQLDLCKCNLTQHHTTGLRFIVKDGCLILASIDKGTPGEHLNTWRTHICRALLISINGLNVSTVTDAQAAFTGLSNANATTCTLTFLHLATSPNILHHGLTIISCEEFSQFTHDQLNNQINLIKQGHCVHQVWQYNIVYSGNVANYTS